MRTLPGVFSVYHFPLTINVKVGWWLGVVISVVGRINEVNQHRARLVHDG